MTELIVLWVTLVIGTTVNLVMSFRTLRKIRRVMNSPRKVNVRHPSVIVRIRHFDDEETVVLNQSAGSLQRIAFAFAGLGKWVELIKFDRFVVECKAIEEATTGVTETILPTVKE